MKRERGFRCGACGARVIFARHAGRWVMVDAEPNIGGDVVVEHADCNRAEVIEGPLFACGRRVYREHRRPCRRA
jgi:hypothetical protein